VKIATASAVDDELGPLSRIVLQYTALIEERAKARGSSLADWAPVAELVATKTFERVGAYQEVMGWNEYIRFLSEWAGTTRFEAMGRYINEIGQTVLHEIEERHYKGDDFIRKNVLVVYRFNESRKIEHLDIYEQAKDSGRWIMDAAQASAR
jgi:hypothetical protein